MEWTRNTTVPIVIKLAERRSKSLKSQIAKEVCINFHQKQNVEENV